MRVTHPFHPWSGREFEFAFRRTTWGEDRVFVVGEDGQLCGLPAGWTDAAAADAFVVVAAGRSALRVDDLHALADLLAGLNRPRPTDV